MTLRSAGPLFLLLGAFALGACSGHNSPTAAVSPQPAEFQVTATTPPGNTTVFLNDTLVWHCNAGVDLDSASLSSVVFTSFDAVTGEARAETVTGSFRHVLRNGTPDPNTLEFRPRLPGGAPYTDGGLRPRRRYTVTLLSDATGPALRDVSGRRLKTAVSLQVFTPGGSTAAELFRNPGTGGPRVTGWEVVPTLTPADNGAVAVVPLGLNALTPIEVHVRFNQPLDPAATNLPQRQSRDPLRSLERARGPVFLVYDDVEYGRDRWIPTQTLLESNDQGGAEVVLVPDGVLPNNAEIRLVVEPALADLSGESNGGDPGYQRLIGRFRTEAAYQSQFDALRLDFDRPDLLDPTAVFLDPPAQVEDGGLRAALSFEGRATTVDLDVTGEVILNTDTVPGGVFSFRNVRVATGAFLRGVGQNPLVLLVTGDLRVDGTLSVNGGNGQRVDTLNSANIPTAGGVGVCGGGHGGRGSPETTHSSATGETGMGPNQQPGLGGQGGRIACGTGGFKRGSGGGGGGGVTQGDPLYNDGLPFSNANFVHYRGTGGSGYTNGSTTPNLQGGAPGPTRGRDSDPDNDFFGRTVDPQRREYVAGEFVGALGGAGGGGGGDNASGMQCESGPIGFINDNKGGGGGAGAGALVIKALGTITVGPTGRIQANGGHGGGGEQAGSNNQGGGGGGGAGGTVVLMAGVAIELHRHGGAYYAGSGPRDYSFSVSADGGASLRGDFGGNEIRDKYPVRDPAAGIDTNGGAFGGMGLVQLMAPPGANTDGTNTVLDDNIHVIDSDGVTRMTGSDKQRFLAWPGLRGRDDAGNAIPNYGGGGDIRPRPLLLPPTFGRYSRARTRWLPTGATVRRPLSGPDGAPRGITVETPDLLAGPDYTFAGTRPLGSGEDGYLDYDRTTGAVRPPVVLGGLPVQTLTALGGTHLGAAVHVVTLQGTPFGRPNQFAHLRLLLRDPFGARVGDFRILAHDGHDVLLDPADGDLPQTAATADVTARLVDVWTGLFRGLGPTRASGGGFLPGANVRVGFAFHQDPANPDLRITGQDQRRFPPLLDAFVYDLSNALVRDAVRTLHAPFVMVDVRFDLDYTDVNPDRNGTGQPLDAGAPRPEVRELVVPYRF